MITQIRVQGFKSLYDVEVELGQVNVLIGANGSGKSNLLEAVGLLAATAYHLSDKTPPVLHVDEETEPYITERSDRKRVSEEFYDQELLQRGLRPGIPRLFLTSLDHRESPQAITLSARFQHYRYMALFPANKIRDGVLTAFARTTAYWEGEEDALEKSFESLRGYAIYAPSTPILRGTQPDMTQRLPIGLAGGRLAEAVDELLDPDTGNFGMMTLDELFELLDWIDDLAVVPPSRDLVSPSVPTTRSIIRFTDRWMRQQNNHISAYDASEGALYVLLALVLAMHPQAPRFFAIDNFDQSMHPRLARATMRVFSQQMLKTGRQALLTTHNPLVLDGLDLRDDRIRLFAVERDTCGETKLHRVQVSEEVLNATASGLSLSNLWVMGRLGGVPDIF